MPLAIDNGTFTGNTFISLINADFFHEDRGNSLWTEETDDAKKESALIRAFDYLSVQRYISTAFDAGVPAAFEKAQCIGALKELESPGILQSDREIGVKVKTIEGAIENQYYEFGQQTIFTAIENLLRPYLFVPARTRQLVRG